MANINFLPRKLHTAFQRVAMPEALKTLLSAVPGNPAYCVGWDDFIGDAADAIHPANGGTGTQVVGITAAPNGTLTLTTQGNQATDSAIQQLWDLNWNGDLGIYMIARWKIDAITTVKFSVGIADEQVDGGPINSKSAATFNVSDLAVVSFDTADDTNLTLQTNGGTNDMNVDTTYTMAANTYITTELVVIDNHVTFYMDGRQMSPDAVGTEVIEGGVAMRPTFYVEQNDTAARTLTLDYCGIIGPRF